MYHTYSYTYTHTHIYTYICIYKEILRNWLMQLQMLANPRICRSVSKSKGLRTRRADGVVPVQRPTDWTSRKSCCFSLSLKAGKS